VNSRDDSNEDEPKPEEDIDLLVDDVERKNAETVNSLYGARGTILVERAFSHFWKDVSHRVESLTVWHLRYGNNITSVGAKFSSKEKVHKKYLANDVDEVECFA